MSEHTLFPNARELSRHDWNLDEPGGDAFALLVAANVFMYASDPERWLENVLARCRLFVLVDLVRRRRSADAELGADGDSMRFALGSEKPRGDGGFDLAGLGERLLGGRTYPGGDNEFDSEPMHFIALLRGDLPADTASEACVPAVIEALSAAH